MRIKRARFIRRLFYFDRFQTFDNTETIEIADKILHQQFPNIGNTFVSFPSEIDWDLQSANYRLRCFKLNYFDFLQILTAAYDITNNPQYIGTGFSLIVDWWEACGEFISGDKWNPFVTAQRLFNWIGFMSRFSWFYPQSKEINDWIHTQTCYLCNNIEYHLGGNHLLMEGKALAFAGAYLLNSKMLNSALQLLEKEFSEQFFSEGGHFERSLSYHIESLQHYFETGMLLHFIGHPVAIPWIQRLYPQFIYLSQAIMPDGSIPLVNDSDADYPLAVSEFLPCQVALFENEQKSEGSPYSRRWIPSDWQPIQKPEDTEPKALYPESYLFYHHTIRGIEHFLLFDIGDNGPDYNLGHAHADALNILWTVGKDPILVDSGTYTYKPGSERNSYRSTNAHNTVEIDHLSSSEIWGAFRVARRAKTTINFFDDNDLYMQCIATHDGYCKVLGKEKILHQRSIKLIKATGTIEIRDYLFGTITNSHDACSRFHLAPHIKVTAVSDHRIMLNNQYQINSTHPLQIENVKTSTTFEEQIDSVRIFTAFTFNAPIEIITTLSSR